MELLTALLIAVGINLVLFIPAFILKTDTLTDLSYALSFVVLAWVFSLSTGLTPLKMLLATMITLWGLRLGGYLVIRIGRIKKDRRFDGIREHFLKFLGFWFLQGVSVWIIMLASLLFFSGQGLPGASVWVGFALWALGLLLETVADYQKYTFIRDRKNEGRWVDSGLWRSSRHPNYLGEILVWIGMYLFTFSSLTWTERLFALASPLFITLLLLFVTGLPQLERRADMRWGHLKEYQAYKRRTGILLPWKR